MMMLSDSESALRVVLDVTESDELKRLREENRKLREMHAALEGLAKGHSDKYCDLVWLARSDRYGSEPHIREIIEKKIAEYPEDYAEMKDPDTGDWTHGFNSGMLAASRLYHEYTALDEFVWNHVYECYCLCEPDPDHGYGRCDCCDFGSDEEPVGPPVCDCGCEEQYMPLDEDSVRLIVEPDGVRIFQPFTSVKARRARALKEFPFLDS